jgi:hypothetical protein
MLPAIMACLENIAMKKQYAPSAIYVTGHSLGAALAVHFSSAVLLGSTYGWNEAQTSMPVAIRRWPWSNIKLRPFALPVVGGETFSRSFNWTLQSARIFIEGDPVTLEARHYPVGQPYGIDPDRLKSTEEEKKKLGGSFSGARHEPFNIRRYLIKYLQVSGSLSDPLPVGFPSDEPWKVFTTFRDLIKDPSLAGGGGPQPTRVDQILGTQFDVRLVQYMEILEAIIKSNEDKQLITDLRNAIRQKCELKDLISLWNKFQDKFASNYAQFLGLCLVLSLVSKMSLSEARKLLEGKSFAGVSLQ